MYSKLYSVILCALILLLAEMVNCRKKCRIAGSTKVCPSRDFPFFAMVYVINRGTCGGVLIDANTVWTAKDCIMQIGAAASCYQTGCTNVKVGNNPYPQIQTAYYVASCDHTCGVAIVKVMRSFMIDYRNIYPVEPPMSSQLCREQPYFVFLPHEELQEAIRPYNYHCTRFNVMRQCPSSPSLPWDNYGVMCTNVTKCGKKTRKEKLVCDHSLAGPLMCGNRVLGFLLQDSCQCRDCNFVKFVKVVSNSMITKMMSEGGKRSAPSPINVDPHVDHHDDGTSVQGAIQTKVFTTTMLLSLYMFNWSMTY